MRKEKKTFGEKVLKYLRYTVRSQIYAKSLPLPLVIGGIKRLELLKTHPELTENLKQIMMAMTNGLKSRGFIVGDAQSPLTPVLFKGGVGEVANMAMDLRENYGIFCSVVWYRKMLLCSGLFQQPLILW